MEYSDLLKKYKIKEEFLGLGPEDQMPDQLFFTYEKFEQFENNYMTNTTFVEDLKKYFYTTINPTEYFAKEILRILKIFIKGTWLHEKFVGKSDKIKDKKPFKNSKFAQALTSSLMEEYKGVKWTGAYNSKHLTDIEISEDKIIATYGYACTRCTDWGQGRSSRGSKRSISPGHSDEEP